MHKFTSFVNKQLNQLEARLPSTSSSQTQGNLPVASTRRQFPEQSDFYRFRKQRGVNLGLFAAQVCQFIC